MYFDILNRSGMDQQCDRWADRHTEWVFRNSMLQHS